jgi:surface antigen
MKPKHIVLTTLILLLVGTGFWFANKKSLKLGYNHSVGDKIDSLNGVYVYYNGDIGNVDGRNRTADGYNLGLKYQCVEFVKRYYYQHLNHKMANSYGDAKDYFDKNIADGNKNRDRALTQYKNPSKSKPKVSDLMILDATSSNKYGHVAIISKVLDDEIEIIQQNPGPEGSSRVKYDLDHQNGKWHIDNERVLGWLRKEL